MTWCGGSPVVSSPSKVIFPRWQDQPADGVERRRLARAVGTDQRDNRALRHRLALADGGDLAAVRAPTIIGRPCYPFSDSIAIRVVAKGKHASGFNCAL